MTAAELLTAWHWQGPLGRVLVVTHRTVIAGAVPDALAELGASLCPTDPEWRTRPWLLATVTLGDRSQEVFVPESAEPEEIADRIMRAGLGLLSDAALADARMTFAESPTKGPSTFFAVDNPTAALAAKCRARGIHWLMTQIRWTGP